MQAAARAPGQQAPVKIYNAVYSSVQVYECMVRGIAVMRRRADSYVNATQILKVAGVDKGRRTKILEKEILPGKHEIVQGGYGKYQGTWIPLERGRDIALQYGVAPLLAPLFDFVPNASSMSSLPTGLPNMTANLVAPGLAPPPIMPGSALRLLNQGRAQGLFTPSTSMIPVTRHPGYASPGPYYTGYPQSPYHAIPGVSPTPPPSTQASLKRTRSEADADHSSAAQGSSHGFPGLLAASPDIQATDRSRPPSAAPTIGDTDHPSPTKRARTEPSLVATHSTTSTYPQNHQPRHPSNRPTTPVTANGVSRPPSSQSTLPNGKRSDDTVDGDSQNARFSNKPSIPKTMDPSTPARDPRRRAVVSAICQQDDPTPVLELLHEITPDNPALNFDIDLVLDEQGHTALHLAASMARHKMVEALIANGADVHRGNYNGETPLIRACLATQNAESQTFHEIVAALHQSIRTIDTSRKSVLHHIVATAGVKGRAVAAHYYLDGVFLWVADRQQGDFRSIVDLQDEHGDTALNIAARVGNRSLVRTLLDVGANRILPNKLGLRPGDFGVETEELGVGIRAEDILMSLRSGPSAPVQKSQDVLAEIKSKQDALDVTQAHLRAATRELAEQRKQIQIWQAKCGELDLITQRMRNIEKAIEEEDKFDWTGTQSEPGTSNGTSTGTNDETPAEPLGTTPGIDNEPGTGTNVPSTAHVPFGETTASVVMTGETGAASSQKPSGSDSAMDVLGAVPENGTADVSSDLVEPSSSEPSIPTSNSVASLIRLRRLKVWHERMERVMEERLKKLQGASAEKEFQCKKIVALCTGVPIDRVEDMLEDLVIAVESEASVIDISRVSGFMQKVTS